MIYVALLRGINVGGNNKVDMKKLKITFESLGFTHVETYINSGNIIFETDKQNQNTIANEIETAIKCDFELAIKVLVRDFTSIKHICEKLPNTWVKNEFMRTDIMFLWKNMDNPQIIEQLQLKPVDNVTYISGALLWNVADKDYDNSALFKLMGTKIYKYITIRNVNTVRKLYQLMLDKKQQTDLQ